MLIKTHHLPYRSHRTRRSSRISETALAAFCLLLIAFLFGLAGYIESTERADRFEYCFFMNDYGTHTDQEYRELVDMCYRKSGHLPARFRGGVEGELR